jgi:hypothetical protein
MVERKNKTLVESIRCMLKRELFLKYFQAEATVTTGIQHMSAIDFPLLNPGMGSSVQHLKTFGCPVYAHILDGKRKKLDDKSVKCIMTNYNSNMKSY